LTPLIRPAVPDDLPVLLEIEEESFAHPHWSPQDFTSDECQVAEVDGIVAGFLVSRQVFAGDAHSPPEREILNLAVGKRFRRLGIASALLRQECSRPATYFLEVRESNVAAQTLYRRFGFREIARRHDYYQSPPETAIVMGMK
jgi:[ribosomal protein S18]-alanine N-acetyltransferase